MDLDPGALADTITRWNRCCDAGHDPDFGRTLMLAPIAEPPFYAIELSPSMLNTQGGPRRNEKGQIVGVYFDDNAPLMDFIMPPYTSFHSTADSIELQ